MHFITILSLGILLVQTACVIHALHQGYSYAFVMMVLLFPLVGAIGYLLIEFGPMLYEAHIRHNFKKWQRTNPYHALATQEQLAYQKPTIENLHNLAKCYLELSHFQAALALLDNLLKNQFSHDDTLLLDKAQALFGLDKYHEAKFVLENLLKNKADEFRCAKAHLLYARTLAALGECQLATREFEHLQHYYTGLEASYYYLQHLRQLNHKARAEEVLRHMRKRLDRLPKHYRGKEQTWLKQAQKDH